MSTLTAAGNSTKLAMAIKAYALRVRLLGNA